MMASHEEPTVPQVPARRWRGAVREGTIMPADHNHARSRIIRGALVALLVLWSVPGAAFETPAKQAFLVDQATGAVLFEKNADERMHPASMSKIMTAYLAFEQLRDGRLKLDDRLPVSRKAWRKGGSKMFVEFGKQVSVEDLFARRHRAVGQRRLDRRRRGAGRQRGGLRGAHDREGA